MPPWPVHRRDRAQAAKVRCRRGRPGSTPSRPVPNQEGSPRPRFARGGKADPPPGRPGPGPEPAPHLAEDDPAALSLAGAVGPGPDRAQCGQARAQAAATRPHGAGAAASPRCAAPLTVRLGGGAWGWAPSLKGTGHLRGRGWDPSRVSAPGVWGPTPGFPLGPGEGADAWEQGLDRQGVEGTGNPPRHLVYSSPKLGWDPRGLGHPPIIERMW